jgi:hypothetical protein|nr:MAG TPA: hypothetical protein [Caudoviricetes sp.]
MTITDGVENTQGAEKTAETNEKVSKEKREDFITFDEILTDPEYKASYDRKVNELLNKKQAEWGRNTNESKDKFDELSKKAEASMLEAVNLRIENALLVKGVDSSKSSRMMRLVDKKAILDESGNIDNSKLNTEIEEILKDFPELSKKSEEKGFTIGGDGKETEKEKVDPLDKLKKAMKLK